jgi:hypothetical protein
MQGRNDPGRRRRGAHERQRRRSATEWTRRYRERLKHGVKIAPVPFTDEIVGMLIDTGWLPVAVSEDRQQIGQAIASMLCEAAKPRRGGDG